MNVEYRESPIHGLGIFARENIQAGHWQYIYGMLVPASSNYGFDMENGTWWEPFPPFRYTNHSDEPNCEAIFCDDTGTMTITALRNISADEELTIDYGYDPTED